jgi:hypothetical protein
MVPVAVDAGWGEDFGQPIQKLQSRETQGGAAGEVGPWEEVADLVRAAADQVEPVEGKGRPSTIPDEPLEADSVMALDTDAGVEAKPAAVIPAEHIFGLVGVQEAVAAKMSEGPFSDRVLEALHELVGEAGGFVEAEAGFRIGWILNRVILDPLEEPIYHAHVVVEPSGPWGGARSAPRRISARPSNEAKLSSMNCGFKDEPKRCRKLTAPIEAVAGAVGLASFRVAWSARSRMWRTAVAVSGRWWR